MPILTEFLAIRLLDVLDILLVTTLVYTTIVLVRRTQAGFVAIGILLLAALYIVARALDLRLTAWIFQGFFAVFLVIIVVIFQEELRQLFERVAMWSLRRKASLADGDASDVLVQCLVDFARAHIGALVVIPGRQPLDRHTHGGIDLNGTLSLPVLKSLFDPHSPGHDGAIVIEHNRIRRFSVICRCPRITASSPASARAMPRRSGWRSAPMPCASSFPRSGVGSPWRATDACARWRTHRSSAR